MLIASVVFVGVLFFLMFLNTFLTLPWDWRQWTIIGFWAVSGIALIVITPLNIYYEINKRYVVVSKYGKKTTYNYSDVVYIDEEKSEKKKVVHFYTNKGHVRYLPFDKEGKIYQVFLQRCHNLLDKEQLKQKYPNIKL